MCSTTYSQQNDSPNQHTNLLNGNSNSHSPNTYMERGIHSVNSNHSPGSPSGNDYIIQRNSRLSPASPRPPSAARTTPVNGLNHHIYHPQPIQPSQYFQEHLASVNYYLDNQDQLVQSPEFLPLCDLLFNIISLAAYFCDVVFDSVTVYTLFLQREKLWFWITLFLVLGSALISQILSLKWYYNKKKFDKTNLFQTPKGLCVLVTHVFQFGVLWRYFKLFVPVDLSSVKHEVRDLCMLRMVHAFTEAAPMLIIQTYLMWLKPNPDDITDLNIISMFLSLFSLCWAMASFSKNVRSKNIHKLVLTWLGVIFQFFWRLGTVTSRAIALTIYATFYGYWVFAVIILHWFSMLLWLLSPKNLFHGEKMSLFKRISYSLMVAWVYIFCYINMQEENSRNKMIAFYVTMFLENTLLLSVCLFLRSGPPPWYQEFAIVFIWGGFAMGILFMILYYKFFHIRHLKHTLLASHYDSIDYNHCPKHGNQQFSNDTIESNGSINDRLVHVGLKDERKLPFPMGINSHQANGVITGIPGVFNCRLNPALKRKKKKPSSFIPPPAHPAINNGTNTHPQASSSSNVISKSNCIKSNAGSSNGQSNVVPSPATFWKNKSKFQGNGFLRPITPATASASPAPIPSMPTKHPFSASIVPSPIGSHITDLHLINNNNNNNTSISNLNVKQTHTRSPISPLIINELENGIAGGGTGIGIGIGVGVEPHERIDIQQKLKEKKQQQLNQLKEIEQEIKHGKLQTSNTQITFSNHSTLIHQELIPTAKKQPFNATANSYSNKNSLNLPFSKSSARGMMHHYYYHPVYRRIKLRSQTPEVLLAPHYMDNSRVFYDYPSCVLQLQHPATTKLLAESMIEEDENEKEDEKEDEHQNQQDNIKCKNSKNITSERNESETNLRLKIRHKNIKNVNNKDNGNFNFHHQQNHTHHQNNYHQRGAIPSDIDSQVSLPRSYTLPREFRYYRGNTAVNGPINSGNGASGAGTGVSGTGAGGAVSRYKIKKKNPIDRFINGNFVASNSSVDGDVDSDFNHEDDFHQIDSSVFGDGDNDNGNLNDNSNPIPQIIRGPVSSAYNFHKLQRSKNYHYYYTRHRRNVPETPL